MNRRRGFTLIELLVVIAIIGVLSAVVLASLNTARSKGNDAAIESDLSTIQTQSELYYIDKNGTYGNAFAAISVSAGQVAYASGGTNFFSAEKTVNSALNAALSLSGQNGVIAIGQNGQSWAVGVNLHNPASPSLPVWCVDSTGASTPEPNSLNIYGGSSDAKCP